MDVRALLALDVDVGPALGQSRGRVLGLLRDAGSPLGVQDIARRMGLHPNTARFHLDALADAGLATRATNRQTTPGRPRMTYKVAEGGGTPGPRHHRLLAEMLTSLIAGVLPDPVEAATQAGREWGRYLTEEPPQFQRMAADEAVQRLTSTLAEIGFAPQTVADPTGGELRLRQCPFREVAEVHQDVVCSLHLGLMQGAFAQMRAPVTTDRLQPFAEPGLCIAHLKPSPIHRRTARSAAGPAGKAKKRTRERPRMVSGVRVRRVYDDPEPADGTRVLVDLIWPQGLREDTAYLDDWVREVAPSTELRTWYAHDPAKSSEFRRRYAAELVGAEPQAALGRLRELAAAGPLTLLTASRDISISSAAVLAGLLGAEVSGPPPAGSAHPAKPDLGPLADELPHPAELEEGGDTACWAHLVCPECGAIVTEGHRQGCALGLGSWQRRHTVI